MREQDIRLAARLIKTKMADRNGGRMPRSVAGWRRLCLAFDLDAVPLYRSPGRFRARLIVTERGAFAFYNRFAPRRQQMRYLAHELAEKVALDDLPSLFDEIPGAADYGGGADPFDARHRIARHVERLCFRG